MTKLTPQLEQALEKLAPGLTDREKKTVAKAGIQVNIPAGWVPIHEHTPADKVYLIIEGEMAVRKKGQEVAVVGPGEIVGETAFLNRRLRNASVVALTPVTALNFPAAYWRWLTENVAPVAQAAEASSQARV